MLLAFLARDFDILMTRQTARMQEFLKDPKITRQNDVALKKSL